MNKKTVRDIDFKGKRVLIRVDFNVPLDGVTIGDDTRIRAALPTINYLLEQETSLVIMSHLGRPKGKVDPALSLKPVSERLSELLDRKVAFAPDCVGPEVKATVGALKPGEVLVLENLRFHSEEEGKAEKKPAEAEMKKRQEKFAAQLAELGEVYVDDAFGTVHRAHASMAVVTRYFKDCVAGFLLEKEIKYLGNAVADPKRPFIGILGGAKISGKIDVLMNLMDKVDAIIVGGGMVYTFYRAKGFPVGNSLVEQDRIEMAAKTLAKAEEKKMKFLLPIDHVVADSFSADARVKVVGEKEIEDGWMALDIGPETIKLFAGEISGAGTVVWNGPMGCFEMEPFAEGTMALTRAIAETDCVSIIGGGDSVSAVNRSGLADRMTHISTGGGAGLEFLEGKNLPGIMALSDR